jgi:glutamate-1-semialdehyde 2,1-aminomutase
MVERKRQSTNMNEFKESRRLMAYGARFLAGGVSSNFRLGILPTPLVIDRGEGAWVIDADGNRLIDYYLGMGPMILGHNPEPVIEAVRRQLDKGILFAAQTEIEFEAARLVSELVPCAEHVRFASSGSEVVQAAVRLARASTGRKTLVKFEGHYHGWFDNILWSVNPADDAGPADKPVRVAGSGGQDDLAGVNTEIMEWNNLDRLVGRIDQGDVAAVIMEPAMCNTGVIPPRPGYLEGVREACTRAGSLLIFDEVITGFRIGVGGAQGKFGVTPDLAVFGKAIANGFPVAALAGRADVMDLTHRQGVLHGGTYNGHPLGMAATVATLTELRKGDGYAQMDQRGRRLMDSIAGLLRNHQITACVQGFPTIFHVAFGTSEAAQNYRGTRRADRRAYVRFTTAMVERGVRALERGAWFMSTAHNDAVIDRTLAVVEESIRASKL